MTAALSKMFSLTVLAAALSACGGSDGSSGTDTGSMNLGLTDAPVDSVQSVFITFTGVSLKAAGEAAVEVQFDQPKTLDLLTLQGGTTAPLLDDQTLTAGAYEWIRLDLSEEAGALYVIDDTGAQHDLKVPSGAQTGLKLVSGFQVPAGGTADFTIDFDVRKSLVLTGSASVGGGGVSADLEASAGGSGNYILKPTLRLIDNSQSGSVAGSVDSTLVATQCAADTGAGAGFVYVFEGSDVTPDDFEGDSTTPEALIVVPVSEDGSYSYKAAFLSTGEYTLAYSCDIDDMATDETLAFHGATNVTVENQVESELNFQ